MKDLTKNSITRHILIMAAPIALGMLVQMAYTLVDLYFVSKLGEAAIAGVRAAGNAAMVVFALAQVLGVGTVAVIAHAVGRKDQTDANIVFNQALGLSALCGVFTLVAGSLLISTYMRTVSADTATIAAGVAYFLWFLPGLALQFAMLAMGSALRGTGIVQPTMIVQMLTVVINAILAPVLIAGWGTGYALGVAGAGLASSIAIGIGVVMLWVYFHKLEHYVAVNSAQMRPMMIHWKRILNIGLPAGGEFALLFIYMWVIYRTIRDFGPAAQAGFGIGALWLQAILLPAMAIAFAAGPIAGQNFGAKNGARVRETFRKAAWLGTGVMLIITALAQWQPGSLIGVFTKEAEVLAVGTLFLQLISWNFVAQGLIFTCSSVFQGIGNTRPALWSSATRLTTFAIPALWLSTQPYFRIEHVWYLSIATVTFQAVVSMWLMQIEFKRRLAPLAQ